jgi:hypothetical protein
LYQYLDQAMQGLNEKAQIVLQSDSKQDLRDTYEIKQAHSQLATIYELSKQTSKLSARYFVQVSKLKPPTNIITNGCFG